MNPLLERFLSYVKIDTTPSEESESSPTTDRQFDLLRLLEDELTGMGIGRVMVSDTGVLYAKMPGGIGSETLGLIAHVDTSPDAPGSDITPILHRNWDGKPIELPGGVTIDPAQTKDMQRYIGGTIVTSDGTTLLGADDKAGVAIVMETCRRLMADSSIERPPLVIAFTPDEEVGRGVDNFDTGEFGADFAYTVDGGCLGYIDTQTFNAWKALWSIEGREVHPGSARGVMLNAVRIASELVCLLRPEEMPENSDGMEGYYYPLYIRGTTSKAEVRLIVRDFTEEGMKTRLQELEAVRNLLRARYPDAVIELQTSEQYRNPGEILQRDRRLVEYAIEGSARAGIEAQEGSIRGGTDGSRLSYMGLPTVNLPTGGEMYHSRTEWIAEQGMELALESLIETIRIWGSTPGNKVAFLTGISVPGRMGPLRTLRVVVFVELFNQDLDRLILSSTILSLFGIPRVLPVELHCIEGLPDLPVLLPLPFKDSVDGFFMASREQMISHQPEHAGQLSVTHQVQLPEMLFELLQFPLHANPSPAYAAAV